MSAPHNTTHPLPATLWPGYDPRDELGRMEAAGDASWPVEESEGDSGMPGPALRASIAALYAAILAVGVVGNVALMSAVCRVRSLRSGPNVQLCSLALGDAILLLACVPVDAAKYFSPQWLFGEFGCKLIPYIQLTSAGVSVLTLTALSADRYTAIVKPMKLARAAPRSALRRAVARAALIWALALALALPDAVFSHVHAFHLGDPATAHDRNGTADWGHSGAGGDGPATAGEEEEEAAAALEPVLRVCVLFPLDGDARAYRIHSSLLFAVYYALPLCTICAYYYHIARALLASARDLPAERGAGRGGGDAGHAWRQVQARRRLARTVLVLAALFAGCWLPAHLLYLFRAFSPEQSGGSQAHLLLTVAARALSFCGSCVNPLALYLLSDGFRAHLRAELCPCRRLLRAAGGCGGGSDASRRSGRRRRRRSTRLASVLTRATSLHSTSSLAGASERRAPVFQLSVPDLAGDLNA